MAKQKIAAKKNAVRILNCIPSRKPETDWLVHNAAEAGLMNLAAAIPASKDLREDAWWGIGDQGATGSCVGWASADSVLRWHFVKANRLSKSQKLSVRFVWMASKETDAYISQPTTFIEVAGTSLKAALDIARKFGCVAEDVLPFGSGKLYPLDPATFYAIAAQRKISSYVSLRPVMGMTQIALWRMWIATKGPVLTRLDVDATWDNARNTQGNMDVYQPATTRGGHAVALVGYTPDRFIVRNSWGTTQWGDKGYGYASLAYAQAAFTESYGVNL